MAILGKDIKGVTDCDQFLSLAKPGRSAAEACARALTHDNGILWWAPDRGHNLYQYLHTDVNTLNLEQAVKTECELDERVDTANVTVTRDDATESVTISVELEFTEDEANVTFTLTVGEFKTLFQLGL